jgi:hypothetical protein
LRPLRLLAPEDPDWCAITEDHVQLIADFVRHHPGALSIDIALGISPARIQRGYRAYREAATRDLIYAGARANPSRYWVTPDPADPGPVIPGSADVTDWPVHSACGACGASIGQAAPWEPWHHCRSNCRECRKVKDTIC